MPVRIQKLPQLLDRKIYKTGQTRGADDDVIFQNRVGRNSTVLIPYEFWKRPLAMPPGGASFDHGFIVLIAPEEYFSTPNIETELQGHGLALGSNALVFYETREQWDSHSPEQEGWQPAQSRSSPLGGKYVARVPATTASSGGGKINRGFTTTSNKGAGIRVYEYASSGTIEAVRLQLEALFWHCPDAESIVVGNGMTVTEANTRKQAILERCDALTLLDLDRLHQARVLNRSHVTVCPLCLEELPGQGFFSRMQQAEGRAVPDLTVTEINMFHIKELRTGEYNHCPYNIGWGHHHCNVVTRDAGINDTLDWMGRVLDRNRREGHSGSENNEG